MTLVSPHQLLAGQSRGRAPLYVVQVVLSEVLQRRHHRCHGTVTEAAERSTENVVRSVEQGVQVLDRAVAREDPTEGPDHPVVALAAGGALAARLVVVEL